MSIPSSNVETDQLLAELRKASGLEKLLADLAKYRKVLEALVSMSVHPEFTQHSLEKIKAVDVLLGVRPSTGDPGNASLASVQTRDSPGSPGNESQTQHVRQFDPDQVPDLRHTRNLMSRFGNRSLSGWNKLVHTAHVEALSRLKSPNALLAVTSSNFIVGRGNPEETRKGYRYVPEIDISIQNVDASHAWSNALRLARHLKAEIVADFEWMNKPEAIHPRMRGRLAWKP